MTELRIERSLKKAGKKISKPLYEKYSVLKDRLFTNEYVHWAASFPGGNDHGPHHIQRVLENLDNLLGANPIRPQALTPHELFLSMMSILYHDVGILRQRKGHADFSKLFLQEEQNKYIFDEHDKDIISSAVVSHSSSKDIELECQAFAQVELIGGQTVRPRVIAALVRFADELDEDFRRADPKVAQLLDLSEESEFYWQFCQRISGIAPRPSTHDITINVRFKDEDVGRTVRMEGTVKSFLSRFAEKLAKINRERIIVNRYLPNELQYQAIIVRVRPLDNNKKWKTPREFVFADETSPSEFVTALPELLLDPAKLWLENALESIRLTQLEKADAQLQRLEDVMTDLPLNLRLRVLYDRACVESLRAERLPEKSLIRSHTLDRALDYVKKWLELGLAGAFLDAGNTPRNEIFRMGNDADLYCLLNERKAYVIGIISTDLRSALPLTFPGRKQPGGGCVPVGTTVQMLEKCIPVEELREGDEILSVDLESMPRTVVTRVAEIHTSREAKCILLNGGYVFTPTQPLYKNQGGWIRVVDLVPGMCVLDKELKPRLITQVERIKNYFEVYTLTTDHPSHNFVAYGLVCGNKKP